ncbi:hypothetical protein PQX77_005657 [Marasmius sp. AFHP31]|nr:hypothetical protein PQX77_005657 [Marasmius sp. AFHP31]
MLFEEQILGRIDHPTAEDLFAPSNRLSNVWAFHFEQLPSTITVFQPQTLKWLRDDSDSATFIKFAFLNQKDLLAEFGTTTVPETQREGQFPFTFTFSSVSAFRIEGLADKKFFTAQPTAILVANSTATNTTFDSSITSTKPPPTTWNPDLAETSPPDSEPTPVPTSTPPASTSDSTKFASIIGGAVGGGGGLVLIVVITFLLLRRKKGQGQQNAGDLEQATMPHPHPHSQSPAPTIEPYPMAERSPISPVSTVKGQSPTTERRTTSDHYKYFDPRDPSRPSGESSSRRAESSVSDDEDRDGSSGYAAVQAQMRMMMQRLERIEAADPEAPPDYVSSYSGLR